MKIQKMKIPAILGALLLAGTLSAGAQMNSDSLYKEPYRPQYHFSPEKGWIGDPSGFMYYQGKYHMYWWGKVESTDLVHYQQITPYAMTGTDDNISYFTGSTLAYAIRLNLGICTSEQWVRSITRLCESVS